MPNFALVNKEEHTDLRINTQHSAELGDNVQLAMTFPFEFRNVQACYPIMFRKSGDEFMPVALFGFEKDENLFLNKSGWDANYIPVMIRKEPFLIGTQGVGDSDEEARVLSLDLDSPRVNKEEGEALFGPLGEMTEYLESQAATLEVIYKGHQQNRLFVNALLADDLLESVTLDITLKDGSRNSLLGFYTINEEKIPDLSAETLHLLNRNDMLLPLFMVLSSMSNIQQLIHLKNQALGD
ncbi:MAG: SapC family protein [Gammaproteobacteria bacterium]|nr:SapC family protein [Gammaproteobacteria bacterium]